MAWDRGNRASWDMGYFLMGYYPAAAMVVGMGTVGRRGMGRVVGVLEAEGQFQRWG